MIKMTKQTDYALQLLIALSRLESEQTLSIKVFSDESTISFLFLQRIAQKLTRSGLVRAVRGAKGGYVLDCNISEISLRDVLESVEGKLGVVECNRDKDCTSEEMCSIKTGISVVEEKVLDVLHQTKVVSLMTV
jgi:Rrf2 family protein